MEGADIYQIAKNCRTSVEMNEKYCGMHIKTSLDAAAINVRRKKPIKREEAIDYPYWRKAPKLPTFSLTPYIN